MTWFDSIKDLVGISIALLAVLLSAFTAVTQRMERQRAAYREIYMVLMSDDLHRGRWQLNHLKTPDEIPSKEADLLLIYRTLGVFDNLAMFVRHRVVPKKWVLDVWHHPLRDMRAGADIIRADYKRSFGKSRPWPELWSLFSQAKQYHSSLPCCQHDGLPEGAESPRQPTNPD